MLMGDKKKTRTCYYNTHKQKISSAESQNVVIAVQRCSVENQKDNIAIDFVPR